MDIIIDVRMVDEHLHGIARYTYELINHMKKYSDIKFYLLTNNIQVSKNIFGENDGKINFIEIKAKFLSLREQLELPYIVNKFKKCIFHSPSFVASPFIKNKMIMTIHDLNHLRYPQFYTPFHKYYYKYIVKPSAKKSCKVLTVSEFSKKELTEWLSCDDKKVSVTYNGIDDKFKPIYDKEALKSVSEKYQLPEKFILYIGNTKPHKNVETLLKAMKYINDETTLVLNGKANESLSKIIQENHLEEKVKFIGFAEDSDLPKLYSLAKIFVFPSLYEGFGLPPLEAMASGCPTIVSNSSSLPEVVGDAAIMFEPLNYKELAQKLKNLLQDEELRNYYKEKGMEQAKKYQWEATADQTYRLYKLFFS